MTVFGVGPMEFVVIAVIAVLILGPDRLPKAMAEGIKWLRYLQGAASNARREIAAAADLDPAMTDDLRRTMSDLGELHPRRIAASLLSDTSPPPTGPPTTPAGPVTPAPPVNSFGASASASSFTPRPADAPASVEMPAPAAFDPDAT